MDLKQYTKSFKSLWGLGVTLGTVGPLGLWVPNLNPPWPWESSAITTLFCVVAVILGFTITKHIKEDENESVSHSRWLTLLGSAILIVGLFSSVLYMNNYSLFVITEKQETPEGERTLRFVIGTEIKNGIVVNAESELELLRDNQYEPAKVWTRVSIHQARLKLLLSFISTFFFLTLGMAILAALPHKKQ